MDVTLKKYPLIILALFGFPIQNLYADETNMAMVAESAVDSLKSWEDLDAWRKKYAPKYDDAAPAEGISDFVERKLSGEWSSLSKLVVLSSKSHGLFEFVTKHLGEITTCESTKIIIENAIHNCPAGLEEKCNEIKEVLAPGADPQCLPGA